MHYEAALHHFPRDDNYGPALGTSIGIRSNADHSRPEHIAAEQVVSPGRHGAVPVRHERAQRWPARPDTDLAGVSPTSIVFADRPVRAAGHLPTDALLDEWTSGDFAKDPPNATVSVLSKDGATAHDIVVEFGARISKATS
jgi:hypothetical protein